MKFKGTVHRYGRDIDTDVIIPARYLNTSDPAELAKHCLEDLDTEFVNNVQPGDIIVADENFGCGSSREHAPIAIKAAGVDVVIAKSFARIFYRNAINIGVGHYGMPRGRGRHQQRRCCERGCRCGHHHRRDHGRDLHGPALPAVPHGDHQRGRPRAPLAEEARKGRVA